MTTPRALAVAVPVVTAVLAGCGGDSESQTDPSTPTASMSWETATASPSAPTVEPATGFEFDLERITMRAPDGWKRNEAPASFLLQAVAPGSMSTIILSDLSAVGDQSLGDQLEIALKSTPRADVLEPVEIAGVEWYHLHDRDGQFAELDSYGTTHNGSEAVIDFSLDDDVPEDEQQQLIDSVLATVEWK